MTTPRRADPAALAAGIALIALPLLGAFFKVFWPGWYLFFLMFAAPVLVGFYVLQVVIAATAFLAPRGVFRVPGATRIRAITASWLTSVGVALAGLFFVDGGDMSYGSAFMYLTGTESDGGASALSSLLCLLASTAWIGAAVWLVVEWIVALVRRRRAARA